jgi:hypothetical protein
MDISRRRFAGVVAAVAGTALLPRSLSAGATATSKVAATVSSSERPALLQRAVTALNTNARLVPNRELIGLVDFSEPSRSDRLQLVDVANGRVLETHLVAHGRGSDPLNSGFVQRFSNLPGSNASSEGSFLVADTYFGKHGRSRRLIGLDPANSMALERAIVIHGASYVSDAMARDQGRVGRSQGCFAVSPDVIAPLLQRLGSGHLLYAGKSA